MKKHFENRQCIISSSIFSPSAANQMCCCKNCSKINRKNVIRKKYRQAINDLKVAFTKTWLYRICEQAVERLRKILN